MFFVPRHGAFVLGQSSQWSQDVSPVGTHVMVISHSTSERAKFFHILGCFHVGDGIYFLFPGFETLRGQLIAQIVCFFDGSFTLEGIDSEVVVLQNVQDLVQGFHVRVKC